MSVRRLYYGATRFALVHDEPSAVLGISGNVRAQWAGTLASSQWVEVRQSPGKGFGLFAKVTIPPYTRIIADEPLLVIRENEDLPQLWQLFKSLSSTQKKQIFEYEEKHNKQKDAVLAGKLSSRGYPADDIAEMVKLSSIFQANGFNVADGTKPGALLRAMFPTISRINHACTPNAHTNYDPKTGQMSTYSLFGIPQGAEIVISYFDIMMPQAQRLARAAKWGFRCTCAACDESDPAQPAHEDRRAQVRNIEYSILTAIKGNMPPEDVSRLPAEAQRMVDIVLGDRFLTPQLPIAYEHLAMTQIWQYKLEPGSISMDVVESNFRLAVEAESRITGPESPATQQRKETLGALKRPSGSS